MCVIVPVTDRSMSPSMSEMPTAAPGERSGIGPSEAVEAVPPRIGAKPIAEKTPRAQSNVSPSNPEKTRGRASGLSVAPASGGRQDARSRGGDGRAERPLQRGLHRARRSRGARSVPAAAAWKRVDAARGADVWVASTISPMGVMPAIGSLPNGKA